MEVAHEALIRGWSKLSDFIDREREFLIWRQRLVFLMREWTLANHSPDALIRGTFLTEAIRWSKEGKLNVAESTFVAASERAQVARRSGEQRPRRWALVGAALAVALALIACGWLTWTRTDIYQIRRVIADTPGLLASAEADTTIDAVPNARDCVVASHRR